jgi:hypothetical protein
MNRTRRQVIMSSLLALLPAQAIADDVKYGIAPPIQSGPYFLGIASLPNPIQPHNIALSQQGEIKSAQEIPSQNNFERKTREFSTR